MSERNPENTTIEKRRRVTVIENRNAEADQQDENGNHNKDLVQSQSDHDEDVDDDDEEDFMSFDDEARAALSSLLSPASSTSSTLTRKRKYSQTTPGFSTTFSSASTSRHHNEDKEDDVDNIDDNFNTLLSSLEEGQKQYLQSKIYGRNVDNDKHDKQFGEQMDQVLQLLSQRMKGQVTNEQVEKAVSKILNTMGADRKLMPSTTTTTITNRTIIHHRHRNNDDDRIIQPDTCNYDTDEDDDDVGNNNDNGQVNIVDEDDDMKLPAISSNEEKKDEVESDNDDGDDDDKDGDLEGVDSMNDDDSNSNNNNKKRKYKKRKTTSISEKKQKKQTEYDYRLSITLIPMGTEAAKMMTAFGDGPKPNPEALETALLGTRTAVQMAIMDARKLHRKLQQDFRKAKHSIATTKTRKDRKPKVEIYASTKASSDDSSQQPVRKHAEGVDPTMLYRALADGKDKLTNEHKCGFHMEELTLLFPEEMRAYQRWTQMHEEYSEMKGQDKPKGVEKGVVGEVEEEEASSASSPKVKDDTIEEEDNIMDEPIGGHMKERAAHFDFRTDRMKSDWYIEYAKVRQGSFLPSAMRVRRTPLELEWDKVRKKRGRHSAGSWENMSGRAVRFLHWLGFDPPNLYPPDEEVTQALAFLAYDRLGRIVEKAIFLRNLEKRNIEKSSAEKGKPVEESMKPLWELQEGEQLTKQDIENSLEDPDVKPATVYGTTDSSTGPSSVQLYFGPGWEERLELEMEEMIASTNNSREGIQISEEEQAIRSKESELLTKMSTPPALGQDALKALLNDKEENS